MIETLAAWVAPAATMIAAIMTAANLGARVTGSGFVIFTIGSVAWSLVGFATGQPNLLATNAVLTLINIIGIWRWLGRQRVYEEGGKSAERSSRKASSPTLFSATGVQGIRVKSSAKSDVGKVVEALLSCETGEIQYVVIGAKREGSLVEDLRAVPREMIAFGCDYFTLKEDVSWFETLPILDDGDWPADVKASPSQVDLERAKYS